MTDGHYPILAIRIDEELKAAVEDAAEDSGQNVSQYVRTLLSASTEDSKPKEHTAA